MKVILIIPPIFNPFCYHIAVPLLAGQLCAENIETLCIDANIGLYNYILNAENSEKLKEILKNDNKITKDFGNYINQALNLIRDKNEFYNARNLNKSFRLLNFLFELYFKKFNNFKLNFFQQVESIDSKLYDLEYFDKNVNIEFFFDDYYKELIKKIECEKPDLIGISFSYIKQIIPGLKLTYLLKKSINSKIVFGGNYISRVIDELPSKELLFKNYCDFL